MATRQVLGKLSAAWEQRTGRAVAIESVGGVDAARRVHSGESFDAVFLASDAFQSLIAAGRVIADSKVDLFESQVAVAVRAGAPRPAIGSENELRQAVLSARGIGYSTGPSGVALTHLFERWGIADEVRERMLQAPPGVPVGALLAGGDVDLGFQQLSELIHLGGIDVIGVLPESIRIVTTFCGGVCTDSTQAGTVRQMLAFMASAEATEAKRRQGMEPCAAPALQQDTQRIQSE